MLCYDFGIMHLNQQYISSIACLLLSFKITLFKCLFCRTPDNDFLRIFRCLYFSFLRPYHAHKLDFCSSLCVFLGYSSSHLGYRCLDLTSQRIYVSHHVRFHESVFLFAKPEQIAQPTTTSSHPTHLPTLITP